MGKEETKEEVNEETNEEMKEKVASGESLPASLHPEFSAALHSSY